MKFWKEVMHLREPEKIRAGFRKNVTEGITAARAYRCFSQVLLPALICYKKGAPSADQLDSLFRAFYSKIQTCYLMQHSS